MKKLKLLLISLMIAFFITAPVYGARYEDLTVGNLKVEKTLEVSGLLQAAANTTGNVWYVNSTGGTNGSGAAGKSWNHPFATVDYAIGKCTANHGDFIIVMPGHAESFTAANGFDADVAGITIIGLGSGTDMPEFTFADTDATIAIGAANVTIANIRLIAGISDIVIGVAVEAAGDNATLIGIEWPVPTTATFEFLDVIDLATTVDNFKLYNSRYRDGTSSAANHFIEAGNGTNPGLTIVGNDIQGRFAVAAIWSDAIDLGVLIKDNVILNSITGQHAIEFTTTATGMIVDNRLYTDTYASTLDPGSMYCLNNTASNAIDLDGIPIPADPAIGTVTAGSADDILKKLYYTADGTGNYPATIAQESALAYLMSKSATAVATSYNNTTDSLEAIRDVIDTNNTADQVDLDAILADTITISGGTLPAAPTSGSLATFISGGSVGLGTPLAASKSLVDAIGTDGTTVADTTTGLAGMIGVNDADNAFVSSTVAANEDGSVFERLEQIQEAVNSGSGTSIGANKSIVDLLGTTGIALVDDALSVVGILGVNDADNAFASNTVVANKDGSLLERNESLQVAAAPSSSHPNYFTVTADMTSATWNTAAAHEIATVTGACRVQIMVETTATIVTTGTNGTIALGFEGNTSAIFAATALDAALTGDVFSAVYGSAATSPASGADAQSSLTHAIFDVVVVTGKDIGYTIATNAATTGTLTFHVWWTPLDAAGAVVAGAGGAL